MSGKAATILDTAVGLYLLLILLTKRHPLPLPGHRKEIWSSLTIESGCITRIVPPSVSPVRKTSFVSTKVHGFILAQTVGCGFDVLWQSLGVTYVFRL